MSPTPRPEDGAAVSPGLTLRDRAVRGVAWSAGQKLSVRLSTIAAFIVLSRQLGPEDFGVVALATSLIAVLAILTELGLATFLVQETELDEATTSTAFWASAVTGAGLAALLSLSGPLVADAFDAPALRVVVPVLSLSVLLSGLSSVQLALLQRRMQFRALATRQVSATVVASVVAVILALLGAGVWALVVQVLLRDAIALVVLWRASGWRPSRRFSRPALRRMSRYGGKVLGMNLLIQVRDRTEDVVIASVLGTAGLGVWVVARRILTIVFDVAVSVIATVALPVFATVKHDRSRLLRVLENSRAMTALVVLPTLGALAVLSPGLVPLVFGPQWEASADLARLLTVAATLGVLVYYDRAILLSINRAGVELAVLAGIVVAHVGVVLVAAPHGLTVLAYALMGRALLTLPVRFFVLRRVAGVPLSNYHRVGVLVLCTLLAAAVAQGVLLLTASWAEVLSLGAAGLVFAGVYLLTLLVAARATLLSLVDDARRLRRRGAAVA